MENAYYNSEQICFHIYKDSRTSHCLPRDMISPELGDPVLACLTLPFCPQWRNKRLHSVDWRNGQWTAHLPFEGLAVCTEELIMW